MARLLVVDDDPDVRALLVLVFETIGHEVHLAPDAVEGLRCCLAVRPDLLVIDSLMPALSGHDAIRRLRTQDLYAPVSKIPVIMLSARARSEDLQAGMDAGATAYVTKPFSPRSLRQAVTDLLEHCPAQA